MGIDTGIDGSHPVIVPNFSNALSRNFTVDLPVIDGPCVYADCVDPANVEHVGHGTHGAGTVASPINGLGITGVAPEATLVDIRAGHDSGFLFLGPTLDALTDAADNAIDVVNMSFYVDPWLNHCPSASGYESAPEGKPTPAELEEQRIIYLSMLDALDYAHAHGVFLVAAAGNRAFDLDLELRPDTTSPDFDPSGADVAYENATCVGPPTFTNFYGNGLVDADAAVASAQSSVP